MKMGIDGKPEDLLKNGEQAATENEEAKSEEKPTFKSRLESFWYFYKWHAIIGALLAVALVISVIQLFRNTDPDAYMMYVGPSTLYVKNKDEMTERAARDIYDYNGDGKTYVSLLEITVGMGEDMPYTAYEANVDANKRFLSELASGDSVVYLLEESFFEKANEQGLLCPLAEIVDPSLLPDDMYDACGVRVSELDYFKQAGFSSVPDDTLLCIRRSPESDSIQYGRTPEYWACNKALVVKMLTYKAENHEQKEINAFDKLRFEADFQALSPGGAISYVEVPNLQNNIPAVLTLMKFIYDNIMYAELNTKSDYCQVCGWDGEIDIVEDDGKLVWQCPNCGNRDQRRMNVCRRTCGYLGTNFFNQGRTAEIADRVLHVD